MRLELSYQPIFGGGVRGINYFDVLKLSIEEALYISDWMAERRKEESEILKKLIPQ